MAAAAHRSSDEAAGHRRAAVGAAPRSDGAAPARTKTTVPAEGSAPGDTTSLGAAAR